MANHVSHGALPYPIKGCRFTLLIPYVNATLDPTDPVTPDTEISQDGGAFADCTEEVTIIGGGNGFGYLTLTGDELNASLVALAAKVASGPKPTLDRLSPRVLPRLRAGTAAGGAAGSLTLDSGAVQKDDYYNGCVVRTTGGTGGGGGAGSRDNQARIITDYAGSTRVATVVPNWEVTPDATTTFEILQTDLAGHVLGTTAPTIDLPSQVDVANLALLKLGDIQITTFDDDTTHAKVVKLVYPRIVDTVLRAHRWRFAIRQAALAQLTGAPPWRYARRYQLPTDPFCLKVVRTSGDPDGEPWELQGRELLTDAATMSIEYVARIGDPQQWDALFLEALTERLAAELAIPITNTPAIRQTLMQTFLLKIQEARTHDGFEGTPEEQTATTLTDDVR